MRTLLAILVLLTTLPCDGQVRRRALGKKPSTTAPLFDPNSIPNCVFACDALNVTNFQRYPDLTSPSDGDSLLLWKDYSPVSNHVSGYNMPWTNDAPMLNFKYYSSGGGKTGNKPRVWLDGTGFTTSSNIAFGSGTVSPPESPWSQPITVMVVASALGTNFTSILSCRSVAYTDSIIFFNCGTSKTEGAIYAGSWLTMSCTLNTNEYYVLTFILNGASSKIRTNGVEAASGNIGAGTWGSAGATLTYLGAAEAGGQYLGPINYGRIWIWNRLLNSTEIGDAENACLTEYGFTP